MSYLTKYKKEDFIKVSWEEYEKTLDILYKKVSKYLNENKIKIDVVVPILRGGAFPGLMLTFKLHMLRVLPVQYKYFYVRENIELRKMLGIPKNIKLPKAPTFLLVENNHCFGLTAKVAAEDLKKDYPGCKIIYTAEHMDYSYQDVVNADVTFYGKLSNETRALNEDEAREKGLTFKLYLFPWENLTEEWETVQAKQFEYQGLTSIQKQSEVKMKIKNED